MKKDNKIGLLVMVLVLGVFTFCENPVYSQPATEGVILKAKDSDENITTIKANKDTLENAKADMANKNYESAITYLNAYINGKPKKYEGYKLRGECYYALRQYELARQDFQTAVDIKTNDDKFITGTKVVSAYVLGADREGQTQNPELGILYGELMYAQKALNDPAYEESFKKAFEYNSHQYLPPPKANDILKINCPQKYGKIFNPQGNDAEIMAVINDIEKGDYHEAAYKLPSLSASLPKYYLTHYLTGVVMAGLEQDNEAIKSFEKAIKLNPNDFESMASLGQIYYSEAEKSFSKSDAAKSVEYFNKAIKLNPNLSTYNYYIGLNNLLIGNTDDAVKYFDKAISQRSNDYNSMYYKAVAQQIKGDYQSVIDGTTKLLNRHVSNYNSVLYLRALAQAKSGNNDAALEDIEKIFTGMNDIYNADIKTTSAKEATLPNYLHYLKAQILAQKGEDATEEYNKAFENLAIKSLASNNGFDFTMSANDLENQIDYIRTTFDSYGKIIPNADGYRITSSMIPKFEIVPVQSVADDGKILSKENVVDLTPSLAQKLIRQDYTLNKPSEEQEQDIVTPSVSLALAKPDELPQKTSENSSELSDTKQSKTDGVRIGLGVPMATPVSVSKGEPMVFTAKDAVSVSTPVAKPATTTAENVVKPAADSVATVLSAPIQKDTESFDIKYKPDAVKQMVNDEQVKISDNVKTAESEIKQDLKSQTEQDSSSQTVLPEKIATILATTKPVIVSAREQKQTEDFNISYPEKTEPVVDNVISEIKDVEVQQKDVTKVVADKVAEVQDYKILYNNSAEPASDIADKKDVLERLNEDKQTFDLTKEDAKESLAKTIARAENDTAPNTVQSVELVAQKPTVILPDLSVTVENAVKPAKVAEKFANVDLNEYNVQKVVPEINPGDEVIVFDPQAAPIFNLEQRIATAQSSDFNTTQKITDNFSQIHKQIKEAVETVPEPVEDANAKIDEVKVAVETTAKEAEEKYEAPELIFPDNVKVEKVIAQAKTDVPPVVPKVRQKVDDTTVVVTDTVAAQRENVVSDTEKASSGLTEQEQEWLKNFLDKATVANEVVEQKSKKQKVKNDNTAIKEFLTDNDEKLLAKAKKAEEKQAKIKAKQDAKFEKEKLALAQAEAVAEEKALLKAEKDRVAEEKNLAKAVAKAEKDRLKEEKAEEKARVKAQNDRLKEAAAVEEVKLREELAAQKAELAAQKAALKAQKAEEKAIIKARRAEEKARLKAEKQRVAEVAQEAETRGAVTVIDGDRLIKVKNKTPKEKKQINWWWKKEKTDTVKTEKTLKRTKQENSSQKSFSIKNIFKKKDKTTSSATETKHFGLFGKKQDN